MLLHNAFAIVCGTIYHRGSLERKEDDIIKLLKQYFREILKGNDRNLGVPFCKFSWLDKKTNSACVRLKTPDFTNPTKFTNLTKFTILTKSDTIDFQQNINFLLAFKILIRFHIL